MPIPTSSLQPKIRLLFLALEATFSHIFWEIRTVDMGAGLSGLLSLLSIFLSLSFLEHAPIRNQYIFHSWGIGEVTNSIVPSTTF
jgi:hypothetical protein